MRRLILFFMLSAELVYAGLNVEEIVDRANKAGYYQGDNGKAVVKMTITDKQGRTRHRELVMLRMDVADGGDQRYYVYFLKPEDVRDMVYLVHKYVGRDDDRWLYLPALDLVRRVSASDERSSFAGSHFVYEDVSGRGIDEDTHELIKEEGSYYVLKNIPKDAKNLDFSYWIVYIDKVAFLPVKAEYYDGKGELYRVLEVLEVRDIQGFKTMVKQKATDLRTGGNTVAEFSDVKYDIGLTEDVFTERYLRKPPKKWLE